MYTKSKQIFTISSLFQKSFKYNSIFQVSYSTDHRSKKHSSKFRPTTLSGNQNNPQTITDDDKKIQKNKSIEEFDDSSSVMPQNATTMQDLLHITNERTILARRISRQLPEFTSEALITLTHNICKNEVLLKDDRLWGKLQTEFRKRIKMLDLKDIADILWYFAYANRHDPKFFYELEDAMFECDLEEELDHKLIGKILWGFSHANLGTVNVYIAMASRIKKIHFEIKPIKLAEYAYYFSKASTSMKGGFGIYELAEKSIMEKLPDMDLLQIKKICEYLLPQNIGSNAFYEQLENNILKLYPLEIEPSVLVSLIKSMSRFRFKTELFSRLQKDIMKYLAFLSNSQIEEILWAFARGRRGSFEFYEAIDKEFFKRMNTLKPRGMAFSLHGFSVMSKGSTELMDKYREYIEKNIQRLNVHCMTKIIVGLKKRDFDQNTSSILQTILKRLKEIEATINFRDTIRILDTVSLITITPKDADFAFIYDKLEQISLDLISNKKNIQAGDLGLLLYYYVMSNKGTEQFILKLSEALDDINQIPKNNFCQVFYSFVEMRDIKKATDFLGIIDDLCSYGEMKYFFDHDNFIKLIWGLATLISPNPSILREYPKLAAQNIKEAMLEINPNTLSVLGAKLYCQVWPIILNFIEFNEQEEECMYKILTDITPYLISEIVQSSYTSMTNPAVKEEVLKAVKSSTDKSETPVQVIEKMTDDFYQFIDIGVVKENGKRVAILILNNANYMTYKPSRIIGQFLQNKVDILNQLGWETIVIDENEWMESKNKDIGQKINDHLNNRLLEGTQQESLNNLVKSI